MCVVLAVSLFAGCAHFESIEYSQEISEENPETIEAFDQFINDIFETEVTENTINLHFTIWYHRLPCHFRRPLEWRHVRQ